MGATPILFLKVILFMVMGEKRAVVIIFLLVKRVKNTSLWQSLWLAKIYGEVQI
jgi:hypothetical protein